MSIHGCHIIAGIEDLYLLLQKLFKVLRHDGVL